MFLNSFIIFVIILFLFLVHVCFYFYSLYWTYFEAYFGSPTWPSNEAQTGHKIWPSSKHQLPSPHQWHEPNRTSPTSAKGLATLALFHFSCYSQLSRSPEGVLFSFLHAAPMHASACMLHPFMPGPSHASIVSASQQ